MISRGTRHPYRHAPRSRAPRSTPAAVWLMPMGAALLGTGALLSAWGLHAHAVGQGIAGALVLAAAVVDARRQQ